MTRTHSLSAFGCLAAVALAVSASTVSAETLLMPKRDFQKTPTSEVVWGITTLPVTTSSYDIDFGDGTPHATGTITASNRSYIAVAHLFLCGFQLCPYTITLTVTGPGPTTETATTTVNVLDQLSLSPEALRNLNINRAIQDGLRYLWVNQSNITNFDTTSTTWWGAGGQIRSMSALATLAFENQGYHVPNNNNPWCTAPGVPAGCSPPGIYEKYVVQRGLNWVMDQLSQLTLTTTFNGGNPCAGIAGPPCTGLFQTQEHSGYATGIAIMAMAGSQAPTRIVGAGLGGPSPGNGSNVSGNNAAFVAGKTYAEVLQRTVDAFSFGQGDAGTGRGGWNYNFNLNASSGAIINNPEGTSGNADGSTMGWAFSGLIDAAQASTVMPSFINPEIVNHLLVNNAINTDGTFDYQTDGATTTGAFATQNVAKAGTALLARFYQGVTAGGAYPTGNPQVDASAGFINTRWSGAFLAGDYTGTCAGSQNKGCAYAMFNVFKGMKSQGITTLPNVGRAAGPGAIPPNDWYADYEDYLVATQVSHNTVTGGNWNFAWSCCYTDTEGVTAIAELILAPTAFVLPDQITLSPATDTNPIGPNSQHTVTAHVTNNGQPLSGVTVHFAVISGPNAGVNGNVVTNVSGDAAFTYNDAGGGGTDHIVATVGSVTSNEVIKIWSNATCDTVTLDQTVLAYPLDHALRTVNILNTPPAFAVTAICQDENPNFENIPEYSQDGVTSGPNSIQLRAEFSGNRSAPSNGRVYHIFFQDTTLNCTGERTVIFATTPGGTTAVDGGPLWNSVTGANSCPHP